MSSPERSLPASWRRIGLGVAILTMAAGALCLGAGPAPGPVLWQPFQWIDANLGGARIARAALLVPVTIRGLAGTHQFQLDTGAGGSSLHGGAIQDIDPSFARLRSGTTVSGTMAGVPVEREPIELLDGFRATLAEGKRIPVIGTLGLSFFEHRILVLDYPAGKFVVLSEDAALPGDLAARATFLPAVSRNGKLYVPLEIDGAMETGFFFDSGASAFPLLTSPEDWRRLTGRHGVEPANRRLTVSSWDIDLTMVGAPMTGALRAGPAVQKRPTIWFTPDSRVSFDAWPATKGLFGNELFADRFVVIVDLAHGRFGIAESGSGKL